MKSRKPPTTRARRPAAPPAAEPERLHRLLSRAGVGSRRQIERWIAEARISVNGAIAGVGAAACPTDDVRLDGRRLSLGAAGKADCRVLAYYKPAGEVCSRDDPEGRPTVFDKLPRVKGGRWVAIGRLDLSTQGLLLFTTDGELANRLMHPSYGLEREYAVRTLGELSVEAMRALHEGVELEDGPARVERLVAAGGEGANRWYRLVLTEGRNREVRRLFEAVGLTVSRLMRVRYGCYALPSWRRTGQMWTLSPAEVQALADLVGLRPRLPAPSAPARRPEFSDSATRRRGRAARAERWEDRGSGGPGPREAGRASGRGASFPAGAAEESYPDRRRGTGGRTQGRTGPGASAADGRRGAGAGGETDGRRGAGGRTQGRTGPGASAADGRRGAGTGGETDGRRGAGGRTQGRTGPGGPAAGGRRGRDTGGETDGRRGAGGRTQGRTGPGGPAAGGRRGQDTGGGADGRADGGSRGAARRGSGRPGTDPGGDRPRGPGGRPRRRHS